MTALLISVIALALIFDYINGFHDAANSIATVVSTKVLTPAQAVVWAAAFNFAAFFIFKDHGVANTVAKTVNEGALIGNNGIIIIMAGLIAAIIWNLFTWWFGIPSSSSHTLIGGFAGAAVAGAGIDSINLDKYPNIFHTAAFILVAPLVGMMLAFVISHWFMFSFRKGMLPKIISLLVIVGMSFFLHKSITTSATDIAGMKVEDSTQVIEIKEVANKSAAQQMGFKKGDRLLKLDGKVVTSQKDLDKIFLSFGPESSMIYEVERGGKVETVNGVYATLYTSRISQILFFGSNFKWILLAIILIGMAIFTFFLNGLNARNSQIWFKRLQLVSSAAFSIGHGGNDAQKVMGIITAALIAGGQVTSFSDMPTWVPLACYGAIALGTMSGGWKIIKTMGTKITKVTPFEGVAAETAGAVTLFVTEALKVPVSTTHTITGAIIGVGATKRLSAVRWGVTISLLWAWILTIPVSALLAAGVYYICKIFLG